jgi:hypothetical protein
VSRTSWEANKQIRVRSKQSEIDKLVEQRQELMDQMGQVAMSLYQQGSLHDPQLSRICASVFELDHDLRNREEQMAEIKKEAYPADQLGPTPTTNYVPPTSPTGSSASGDVKCPQCGNMVRANSAYCRSCGAKLR